MNLVAHLFRRESHGLLVTTVGLSECGGAHRIITSGSRMSTYVSAGTVTVGRGNNSFAEGENTSEFRLANHLPNTTLTEDGKVLVQNGKLMRGAFAKPRTAWRPVTGRKAFEVLEVFRHHLPNVLLIDYKIRPSST